MTRVNLGIDPSELCDQHLVAEYRELPRVFSYSNRTVPGPFRLGKGHVLWCSQYPGTMADRYTRLVAEMRFRGFTVNYPTPRAGVGGRTAEMAVILAAREVVVDRIAARLETMLPRWTRRAVPMWAQGACTR